MYFFNEKKQIDNDEMKQSKALIHIDLKKIKFVSTGFLGLVYQ